MKNEFQDTYHFKLARLLAEGGMGNIYEAILCGDEGFEKRVAIKMVREEFSNEKDFVKLFIGEARLVADLVHQNIVQIYKLGKVENSYYIAMEYVHGVNLRELMAKHEEVGTKIPVELGAFIISRVCRGLEYAHAKTDPQGNPLGVVHRDINPNNLMIATEGEVKITDFGVAKAQNFMEDKEGKVIMGKAPYMSPEQAKGGKTDKRSDIFSLGTVMFELLTGESLFSHGEDVKQVMENVCSMTIPPPRQLNPEIPEALEAIILKALERDLAKRYPDAGKFGYDLEYFMYHKGYGPTIQTLEKHLRLLFPKLYIHGAKKDKSKEATKAMSARWLA